MFDIYQSSRWYYPHTGRVLWTSQLLHILMTLHFISYKMLQHYCWDVADNGWRQYQGNYPWDNYTGDNYPLGQLSRRTTTLQPIIHQDNYPLGPLPLWDNYLKGQLPLLLGQLSPRTIAPIEGYWALSQLHYLH